jgi:hypothetical protein
VPIKQFMLHPSLVFVGHGEEVLRASGDPAKNAGNQSDGTLAELVETVARPSPGQTATPAGGAGSRAGLHDLAAYLDPEPVRTEPVVQAQPGPEPKAAIRRRPDARWLLTVPHAAAALLTLAVLQGWLDQARPVLLPILGSLVLVDLFVMAPGLLRSDRVAAGLKRIRQPDGVTRSAPDSDQTVSAGRKRTGFSHGDALGRPARHPGGAGGRPGVYPGRRVRRRPGPAQNRLVPAG